MYTSNMKQLVSLLWSLKDELSDDKFDLISDDLSKNKFIDYWIKELKIINNMYND